MGGLLESIFSCWLVMRSLQALVDLIFPLQRGTLRGLDAHNKLSADGDIDKKKLLNFELIQIHWISLCRRFSQNLRCYLVSIKEECLSTEIAVFAFCFSHLITC